jgi:membrane fusion protein, multidrug efflux system
MEQQAIPTKKKKKIAPFIILGVILILGGWYAYNTINHNMHFEETDNAQVETNAVPVLTRVAGYVDSINLSDYQNVHANDIALTIDNAEFKIAVQQAEADLLSAKADYSAALADVKNSNSQINNINANTDVAQANAAIQQERLSKANTDMQRDEALYNAGAITRKQWEDSKANYNIAVKQLQANDKQVAQVSTQTGTANAQIERSKSSIEKANALIAIRQAALETAKLKLSYTKILMPINGKIGKINLQKGQYIQPGQPLFSIVNNQRYWVVANFKETQLAKLKIGQTVNIKMDGYPSNDDITGKIVEFSDATGAKTTLLPADNASGNFVKVTQRVPVKIEFDNIAPIKEILKAGLSVSIEVKVK